MPNLGFTSSTCIHRNSTLEMIYLIGLVYTSYQSYPETIGIEHQTWSFHELSHQVSKISLPIGLHLPREGPKREAAGVAGDPGVEAIRGTHQGTRFEGHLDSD